MLFGVILALFSEDYVSQDKIIGSHYMKVTYLELGTQNSLSLTNSLLSPIPTSRIIKISDHMPN